MPENNTPVVNSDNTETPDASNAPVATIFSKMDDLIEIKEEILEMLDSRRTREGLETEVMESITITLNAIGNLEQSLEIERQVTRYGNMSARDYNAAVRRGEVSEVVQRRIGSQPVVQQPVQQPAPETREGANERPEQGGIWSRFGTNPGRTFGTVHQVVEAPRVERTPQPTPERAQTVVNTPVARITFE